MKKNRAPRHWTTRFMLEVALTAFFWGAWVYFVLPLISVILWYAGFSLFVEEMFERGGIEGLIDKLRTYGLVVLAIMVSTMIWTRWNRRRYGGQRNTRTKPRPDVDLLETAETSGLDPQLLMQMHDSRRIVIEYDNHQRMHVVELEQLTRTPRQRRPKSRTKPRDTQG